MQPLLDWLTNLENLKSIVPTIIGFILTGLGIQVALPAFRDWRKRRRKRAMPAGNLSLLCLAPSSKDVLMRLMGGTDDNRDDPLADFNITYQQRVADREIRPELEAALKNCDWVLVVGKTGIGKSREIYHLAELLNGEGWQILKLQDKGEMWLDEPKQLSPEIDPERNTLIVLDDLNRWVQQGNFREITPHAEDPAQPLRSPVQERLVRIIEFYQRELRRGVKVIATARNEPEEWVKLQIDRYPNLWQKFQSYPLPEPEDSAIVSLLIDRVDNIANLQGDEAEYPQIAAKNDRTFRNIIENLKIAKNRDLTVTDGQFANNLTQTWRDRYNLAVKKYPAAVYVYDAVELLLELNLFLHPQLVINLARILIVDRGVRKFKIWWQIPRAVRYLARYEDILKPRDGQIQGKNTSQQSIEKIAPKIVQLIRHMGRYYPAELLAGEFFDLGNALYKLGRYEEAITSYNKAIEFKPNKDESWNNRGVALVNLGRYEEAIASYDKAIEFKPNDDAAWYNRGVALVNLGRYEEAIASYQEALTIRSQNPSAFYNIACIHALQCNIDNALSYLQRSIELAPDKYIDLARQDEDLISIRNEPRFMELANRSH